MARDPILDKAIDFTKTEDICLAVWLEAVLVGEFALARDILQKGLLAEHYRSLLPNELKEATPDQLETLARLNKEFDETLKRFRDRRREKEREREEIDRGRYR